MNTREKLTQYVEKKLKDFIESRDVTILPDDIELVVRMGISILDTKYPELDGFPGGSFAKSVVENNLMEATSRADNTNIKFLQFYCQLLYNFSPYIINN